MTVALIALFGCTASPNAPFGAIIEWNNETIELVFDENSLDPDDGGDFQGNLYALEARVYLEGEGDREREQTPLNGVKVEGFAYTQGTYLISEQAIKPAPQPEIPENADMSDCVDDDGNFRYGEDDSAEWCAWFYDEVDGTFYQFSNQYASAASDDYDGFSPNYWVGETNSAGVVRLYMFVDYLMGSDGNYLAPSVAVTIGTMAISLESEVLDSNG